MHIHLRQQAPNKGHLPSWEIGVSRKIQQAIRKKSRGIFINHTTGTSGSDPFGRARLRARNQTRDRGPGNARLAELSQGEGRRRLGLARRCCSIISVEKVQGYLDVMKPGRHTFRNSNVSTSASCAASASAHGRPGSIPARSNTISVMGVASGIPFVPELLPMLLKLKLPEAHWQVTAIGRAEIWPLVRPTAPISAAIAFFVGGYVLSRRRRRVGRRTGN